MGKKNIPAQTEPLLTFRYISLHSFSCAWSFLARGYIYIAVILHKLLFFSWFNCDVYI